MRPSIATIHQATATGPLNDAPNAVPGLPSLRFFVGVFLASSVALNLTVTIYALTEVKLLRFGILGLTSVLALRVAAHTRLSSQAMAWLASGLYACGTVVYTTDVPATVLRGSSFLALTITAFLGGFVCYRHPTLLPNRLPRRVVGLLAVLSILSFVGLVLGAPEDFYYKGLFRGVFAHSNTLGAFAALWFIVGVGVYDSQSLRRRRIVLAGLVAMAVILVASKCRAGLGATLVATACYFVTTRRVGRLLFAGVSLGTIIAVVFLVLPSASDVASQDARAVVFKGGSDDVLRSRREEWDTGWENFRARPFLGHGFGTTVGEDTGEWKLVNFGGREKCNFLIAALEETGVFGSPVMMLPVFLCLAQGFRLKRLNSRLASFPCELRSDARLSAAFWAGAVGGIVNNLGEYTLWVPGASLGGMLIFLAGAAEGLMLRTEERA